MNDERYHTAHHDIHIWSDISGADWDVWLELNDGDLDGVCLGGGESRDAAVQIAVDALESALRTLQETPSPETMKKIIETGNIILHEDGHLESLTEPE